ncbi:hypothetical protein AAEO57_19205 [Flavobacterium sp. DGU38]|uniref:Response regulator receiver domain-containing protein n=1 Tax=Flavobacterium calami TaxID=3139144 RepID=A0ABU9IU10_9FLAO
MNKKGPILLIEENKENRSLFEHIISDLGLKNSLLCFNTFLEARNHIVSKKIMPFLLFSNVLHFGENSIKSNYSKDMCLKMKCPCLFFSILFTQFFVIDTYSSPPKSYFITPCNEDKFKQVINSVIDYWSLEKSNEEYRLKWRNKSKIL